MQFSFSVIALAALAGFAAAYSYEECKTASNTCRTAAGANMASCAGDAAACCDNVELNTDCPVYSPAGDEACFAPYSDCYTNAGLAAPTQRPVPSTAVA